MLGSMNNEQTLDWLLEECNPGIRVRALTGLCGLSNDHTNVIAARELVIKTLKAARDTSWMEERGTNGIKHLTALAESGLRRHEVLVDPVVSRYLAQPFDAACSDMMLLRALVMLGYGSDSRVKSWIAEMSRTQLEDGGWFCLRRLRKMDKTPKSCIKASSHALLLAGEMEKRGIPFPGINNLIGYFLKRRLFYRMDDPMRLVIDGRPGWRMIDVFFPIEFMRIGFPMLLEALAALGKGQAPELREAWSMLDAKLDTQCRITLEGTLVQSYLPKERVGHPSKWSTLYAWLAYRARDTL